MNKLVLAIVALLAARPSARRSSGVPNRGLPTWCTPAEIRVAVIYLSMPETRRPGS